jgi:hypothetical protein
MSPLLTGRIPVRIDFRDHMVLAQPPEQRSVRLTRSLQLIRLLLYWFHHNHPSALPEGQTLLRPSFAAGEGLSPKGVS